MRVLTVHFAMSGDASDQETDAASDVLEDVVDSGALLKTVRDALSEAGMNPLLVIIEEQPDLF
jgi:hypoxanthine-guanine phosphoribosyltransferase